MKRQAPKGLPFKKTGKASPSKRQLTGSARWGPRKIYFLGYRNGLRRIGKTFGVGGSAGKQANAVCAPEGFSAVELLITLIVVGVVFTAFTDSFISIQNINKKATDIATGNQYAFAKLQEYETLNYNSLPNTTPVNTLQEVADFSASLPTTLEQPRVGKVYVNTKSNSLKQVVVRVTFGSGAVQRYIEYVTMIQKNGIGR